MGAKLLYEALREEQEPFVLHSFLREPRSRSSALQRSSSVSLAQLRSGSVRRRPLLSCLGLLRNPFSSPSSSAAGPVTLRALSRRARDDDPQPFLQQTQRGRRRKKKQKQKKSQERSEDEEPRPSGKGRARWSLVRFLAKRLLARKLDPVGETPLNPAETAKEIEQGPSSPPLPECPTSTGADATAEGPSEVEEIPAVRRAASQDEPEPGSPATPGGSAGRSPEQRRFRDGGAAPHHDRQGNDKEEQSSPVSVLDPPFHDEDADNGDEDRPFRLRLASLERTREELLLRISRFENIATEDDTTIKTRRRPAVWDRADSAAARRLVDMDLRREWVAWSWGPDQAPELAAEVSRSVFDTLVDDLALELST